MGVRETDGLTVEHALIVGDMDTEKGFDEAIGVRDAELQPDTVKEAVGDLDGDAEPVPVIYGVVATGDALTLEHCEDERD